MNCGKMSSYNLMKQFTTSGIASPKVFRSLANTCGSFTCTDGDRSLEISSKIDVLIWYNFVFISF